VRDIIVDVEKALISTGEALKNLLLSKNYATQIPKQHNSTLY
jgi:hypothetical protein